MPTHSSRRAFFHRLTAAAAYPAMAQALAATVSDEAYWQVIRQQFPFGEDKVPMNAANLCPSPLAVSQRVTELTRDIDIDCSFQNRAKFAELLEASRTGVAEMMHVDKDEIALVRNTSEANNIINAGLPLGAADEVVVWEQNHPTNNVAWDVRAKRYGLSVKRVSTPAAPKDVDDLIRPFEKALSGKTRVLTVTHASNVSGIRLPVKELAALAHAKGIHFHVDGAQTWGALDVNLRDLGCDSYSASAHKWFVGPKEVGLLYVRKERIDAIWPSTVAPGWGSGATTELVGARKFESMGQRDDAALSAIGATAEFHATIGGSRTQERVLELAKRLMDGLGGIGAKLTTPQSAQLSAGVVIMQVPAANRQALVDAMYAEHGIAGSTSGGFRLCPHLYNTAAHVDRAIEGLKALKRLWA